MRNMLRSLPFTHGVRDHGMRRRDVRSVLLSERRFVFLFVAEFNFFTEGLDASG